LVYQALRVNLGTGQMVAIKRIRTESLDEHEVKQLVKQLDLIRGLSHPHLIRYEAISREATTVNIIMELMENGSLSQTLKNSGKLDEQLSANYVAQMLQGLSHLHECHIVHRNVNASNILVSKTGHVRLSGFGSSLHRSDAGNMDAAGAPNWMAPEVIELKGTSYASDIWSLACTIIELLTGGPPYLDIKLDMSSKSLPDP
jgi:serine/threonine protein kinase